MSSPLADAAPELPAPEITIEDQTKTLHIPPWNTVLLNDNDHTYEYVIQMLCKITRVHPNTARKMASEVDSAGRVIIFTGSRERCELMQQQIHNWGADPLIPWCKGSMSAIIEEAV
ncbi:MAG: ATP-dependent Clp protease adaptor ClpS [bacterium]|jgi:ATP-dependent Clp protease adaptor protein ClpS|nr:ATP-dependent Clp protease adaptor ClpS [bacterium]